MANLSEHTEQHFQVGEVPTVMISSSRGDVHVVAGARGQVAISVQKRATAFSEGEAQRILENIIVEMVQEGDTIRLETRPRDRFGFNKWFKNGDAWYVDIDITVPATTNLRLALNAGNASLRDITGALDVQMNAGNLTASDLHVVDHAEWHMNSGNVTLERVAMDGPARFEMNSGRVTLHTVTFGADTEVKANSGDIRGDVALGEGAHLRLDMNAGKVQLELPATTAAHLDAVMTAGHIRLNGFPITVTRRYAQAIATGDLAPNPTSTITCRMTAGDLALAAK